MTRPVRAQLVEIESGRRIPVTDAGVRAGGLSAEIALRGADGPVAFVDPTDEGFVITDAGRAPLTVNEAPVIGQRLAQLGDQVAFGGMTFRIEAAPDVAPDGAPAATSVPAPAIAPAAAPAAAPAPVRSSALRSLLGWLFVIVVVVGSGVAGYLVAAMLRSGR
ncbi:MAG: hypothetical protein ACO31W_02660 [Gemmatimonadaceae bacterium]